MSVIGQAAGIAHGTMRGYRQHKYRQIDVCEACLDACREHAQAERGAKPRHKTEAQAAWYGGQYQHAQGPSVSRDITQAAPQLSDGTVRGSELQVGDVIDYLRTGVGHRIDRFEPYAGSLQGVLGAGVRIARSADGWGMTVGPNAAIRILPRAAEAVADAS